VGEFAMNRPQGMPSNAWPITRTASESALIKIVSFWLNINAGGAYEEGDEDGGVHENKSQERSQSVTQTVGDRSSHEDANESATLTSLEEGALPLGLDGFADLASDLDTVALLERRQSEKLPLRNMSKDSMTYRVVSLHGRDTCDLG
jgi:hypothetical protein